MDHMQAGVIDLTWHHAYGGSRNIFLFYILRKEDNIYRVKMSTEWNCVRKDGETFRTIGRPERSTIAMTGVLEKCCQFSGGAKRG